MVVAAEFGAFAPLSVIQSRPPWAFERRATKLESVHDLGSLVVQRFSIQANTFPSGHAAGSLAVALALIGTLPWTGAAFLLLVAASISLACVVGRYHYIVDVLAGVALALGIWLVN